MTREAGSHVVHTAVVDEPITLADHEAMVIDAADGKAGAVVGFVGAVRDHDGGRTVTALHYSGHPTATKVLAEVVAEVSAVDGVRGVPDLRMRWIGHTLHARPT